jgi:hypothetical protein
MPNFKIRIIQTVLVFLVISYTSLAQSSLNIANLREILREKDGIFPITQDKLTNVEKMLATEATRTNTTFKTVILPISEVKNNISQFINQESGGRKLTHLGVFYGLETIGNKHNFDLSMWGVRLDHSATANLQDKPLRVSPHVFSGKNASLDNNIETKAQLNKMRSHFKETFKPLYDNHLIIFGTYMRLEKVLDDLIILENQGCDKLRITYGFMKAVSPNDYNCFHLIFRGVNSETNTLSTSIFSTFDGMDSQNEPKLSCPPFGEPNF